MEMDKKKDIIITSVDSMNMGLKNMVSLSIQVMFMKDLLKKMSFKEKEC
jgi:hypothetical protein